ncbi:SAM-dependent methyltransferase [Acinetobacter baumannii]|uniref:DNA adenine methylase n=1 Tax=Acinetobacter baumannii TaxID=470 RepID=UPI0010A85FEA|nr:DNA adenine methylase [Acinetobacter baumannii]THV22580.1 SAM-dependent methyltransferase [Acinetobacter baumannii]
MDLSFSFNQLNKSFYQTYSLVNFSEREVYQLLVDEFQKKNSPLVVDFKLLFKNIYKNNVSHDIHSYPGKLYPNLARFFCKALYTPEEKNKFLDPFSGSGTTIVEAMLEGYETYYCDINPLALLLTKVKTTPLTQLEIEENLVTLTRIYNNITKFDSINVINQDHWYDKRIKLELDKLINSIKLLKNNDVVDLFKVAFSHLARKMSYCDLQVSVPVKIKLKPNFSDSRKREIERRLDYISTANTLKDFIQIVEKFSESINLLSNETRHNNTFEPKLLCNDINLIDKKNFFDLIITSPPYGAAQKYIRSSSLSLNWLELSDPNEVTILCNTSIGKERVSQKDREKADIYIETLDKKYQETLYAIKESNLNRYYIMLTYLYEMEKGLDKLSQAVKNKGKIVLIVGNNTVSNQFFHNDIFLSDIMKKNGFHLEIHLIDFIKTRGLMIKRNKTSGIINYESILVFQKNEHSY